MHGADASFLFGLEKGREGEGKDREDSEEAREGQTLDARNVQNCPADQSSGDIYSPEQLMVIVPHSHHRTLNLCIS
jgi:hypothetical protein